MHKIEELISKYNAGVCTPEEKELLEQWYNSFEWNNKGNAIQEENMLKLKREVWSAISHTTLSVPPENSFPSINKPVAIFKWRKYAAAAAIIAAFAALVFYISIPVKKTIKSSDFIAIQKQAEIEVQPGTRKAQLVLGNGSVVALDSALKMELKEEDGTRIDKQAGQLVYQGAAVAGGKTIFNTLSTPRGGEYQLVLPDSTKVWLNAASSLRFPTRFEGKERIVYLHGEAYFEVAKNTKMPFLVKLDNDLTVQVLGTHFNIMGYNDEDEVRTTLAEGSVKVTNQNKSVFLSPSTQAVLKKKDQYLTVSNADVNKALAWKNGYIEFEGDDLPYIMRQLSRWYNVDISFQGKMLKETYRGAIRRQAPLSKVLEILKTAGVQFQLEGKKLIVTGG